MSKKANPGQWPVYNCDSCGCTDFDDGYLPQDWVHTQSGEDLCYDCKDEYLRSWG